MAQPKKSSNTNISHGPFIEITIGQYRTAAGGLNHVVYALGEDGLVYKDTKNGWALLDGLLNPSRNFNNQQKQNNDPDLPF